jgi:hypothetical protein
MHSNVVAVRNSLDVCVRIMMDLQGVHSIEIQIRRLQTSGMRRHLGFLSYTPKMKVTTRQLYSKLHGATCDKVMVLKSTYLREKLKCYAR